MTLTNILSNLSAECPWRDTLHWYNTVDSTNTQAKALARQGAPHGTVLVAGEQTGGRGRMGRSFDSQAGMGVYLSVILRPGCTAGDLMHLTCAAGVAACQAVEKAASLSPRLKWINDLVLNRRKLGGILAELSVNPTTSAVDYAIVGIGINCRQRPEDFPLELEGIATSLLTEGRDTFPEALAAALVEALWQMDAHLLEGKPQIMDEYRSRCITLGQEVQLHREEAITQGVAVDMDNDGALLVRLPDGSQVAVNSGEVSVRGLYGYI